MRPDVAVLIPTLNEAAHIGAAIEHVRRLGAAEIVVADGGSSDDTVAIARSSGGVLVVEGARGRGGQMNAAAYAARSPVLLFLHADTRLPDGSIARVAETLADPAVTGGAFRVRFDDQHRALQLFAWFSRFDTLLTTFGDQGYFMRRADFLSVGGFPHWPLLEDVELRRRLRRIGAFRKLPVAATTSARRFRARGPWRAQIENALILGAYAAGVSPARLARYYHRGRRPAATRSHAPPERHR